MDFNKPLVYNPNVDLTDYQPNSFLHQNEPSYNPPPQREQYNPPQPREQYHAPPRRDQYYEPPGRNYYEPVQRETFYQQPIYKPKRSKKNKLNKVKKNKFVILKQLLIMIILFAIFSHNIPTTYICKNIPHISVNDTLYCSLIMGTLYSIIILIIFHLF